jgi:transcriptional regulator with XRE-family HTH domain
MVAKDSAAALLVRARRSAGLSQRQLASRAGTSGATIAAYEGGHKEPRLSTLCRLIEATGSTLVIGVELHDVSGTAGPLSLEDRRSLAFHRAVLRQLLDDPEAVRQKGLRNVVTMRRANDGSAAVYFDQWERLLLGTLEELIATLTSLEHRARDLRQVTPFAGVVPARERWDIVRAYRRESQRCAVTSSST